MTTETITRSSLIDVIYKETGVTRSDATALFDVLLESIGSLLKENHIVKINRFGNFVSKQKAERTGRNPKTGQEVVIPAHYSVSFKPSQTLKDAIA